MVAHPGGSARVAEHLGPLEASGQTCFVVGPEGGLTDAEVEAARAGGWLIVDLGPRIVRVETAAVLLVAMLRAGVGE